MEKKREKERERFSPGISSFIVTLSSALGLGNIWAFPSKVGQNGGSAFILIYVISIIAVGIPVMTAELIIGRRTRKNIINAFAELGNSKNWQIAGFLGIISAILILFFYTGVAGWVYLYTIKAIRGDFIGITEAVSVEAQFYNVLNGVAFPIFGQLLVISVVIVVLILGVKKGIEKVAKIAMPILLIIILYCNLHTIRLSGFGEALKFLFYPDFSKVTPRVFIEALGFAFFKLSIGVGSIITYGSYFDKKQKLIGISTRVAISDLMASFLIGIVIFTVVFTFSMDPTNGPTLLFNTIPLLFSQMGSSGNILLILFFILASIAATTATMSLAEAVISVVTEKFKLKRTYATLVTLISVAVVGSVTFHKSVLLGKVEIPKLGYLQDIFDYLSSNLLMPFTGLLTVILLGYVVDKKIIKDELTNYGETKNNFVPIYFVLIKYVTPAILIVVFLFNFI